MKVLILSHLYPSSVQPVYGTFVQEQVKELIRQGCEVKVVSPVKSTPFPLNLMNAKWRTFSQVPKVEEKEGITVYHPRYVSLPKNIRFEKNGENMYKSIRNLVHSIKKEFDFDLIHAHVALPDGFAARKLSSEMGVPYVVTVHGEDFFKSIYLNDESKEAIRLTLKDANKVIFVSERLNRVNQELLNIPPAGIRVIHNGINDLFLNKSVSSDQQYFKDEHTKILSVCHLIERKGIEYNIRALGQLKEQRNDFHYIIVGDGPERASLEQLTKELGLQNHITFLGAVVPEKVKELMDESEIFCLPSWNEAFGVVYIEAMASGNAVIGCKGEGVEEIVTPDLDGILVPQKDANAIKDSFEFLLKHPEKRGAMAEKAVVKVKNSFTWKKNVSEIIDVYKDILKMGEYNE